MSIISILRQTKTTFPFRGHCPVCTKATLFVACGNWLREDLKCVRCKSPTRERAVIDYIARNFIPLSRRSVYEPSPTDRSRRFFEHHVASYDWSFHPSAQPADKLKNGGSCQDLESLTFADKAFDLVITQDVFEHIANPAAAFAEVSRILAPGGSHVFTIPWYPHQTTQCQAEIVDGQIVHLAPPEYHGDPFDSGGALVFNRFGYDIADLVAAAGDMSTTITEAGEKSKGILGDALFIFHSVKQQSR